MYNRLCPKCGKELNYTTNKNRNQAEKKGKKCGSCVRKEVFQRPEFREKWDIYAQSLKERYKGENNPFYGKTHTEETKKKIQQDRDYSYHKTQEYKLKMSLMNSGSDNPMYGKTVYGIWLEKYGEEEANRLAAELSKKKSENAKGSKNPMFGKPAPTGAGNGWGGWYKEWYFRSLKELSYMIYVIEKNNYKWESAEQKYLQIPYISYDGSDRTYRADFLLDNKILVEVKPKRLMDTPSNKIKRKAAEQFCSVRGYEYRMVDIKTLSSAELDELCKSGLVKLLDPSKLEKYNGSR